MSARLTRGERAELAAAWPDFWTAAATAVCVLALTVVGALLLVGWWL